MRILSKTLMNQKIGLGVIVMITLGTTIGTTATILSQQQQEVQAAMTGRAIGAPMATSGDNNVYVVWWTNKTGNNEVMFRASNDGGATFAKKINLSNTPGAESEDAQIAASGENVFVTWWERNQTGANTPVMKISTDNGKSFGPMLKLASNNTISSSK
jgi:hypothetical protein